MLKWRLSVALLSGILFIWGMLPLPIARIRGVGVITPVVIGLIGLCAAIFPQIPLRLIDAVRGSGRGVHALAIAFLAVILVLVLLFIVVSVLMICGASDRAPDQPVTVIVPGAQIHGERPSRMLADRLKAAAAFLERNSQAVCVVSGGQGVDEMTSEAAVMAQYLTKLGVEETRIYLEDQSTNTMENMRFSAAVIRDNGLPEQVVIATQEFHQYRCAAYARKATLVPAGSATCGTPWYLFLCYWVREFAGICRMWLLHY